MQQVKAATLFSNLLMALYGCEEGFITRQDLTASANQVITNPLPESIGGVAPNPGGQSMPYPTIIEQTFIPEYSLFAHTKCHAWRIEWPIYPAGTDPNKIPTVFSVATGALNSFYYLNNMSASDTYQTNFNLYHNARLETAGTLWDELIYSFGAGDQMETTWFNKTNYSAKTIEYWVKERPGLFESNWQDVNDETVDYKQGDIILFKLMTQHRYGGIRIVSMTPRIIEVYLTEPNN